MPITVGIVGVNYAEECLSFEGEREFLTNGKKYKHPIQEAADAEQRLRSLVAHAFDEFLILRFVATNQPPYGFHWVNEMTTMMDYGSVLARISQQYEKRF
jgi:hypothetical protein